MVKWIVFIYFKAWHLGILVQRLAAMLWLLMVLCCLPSPILPLYHQLGRKSLWFLSACTSISHPTASAFNSLFLHFNPKKFKSPNRSEKFSHFPCLFTHSFIQCLFIHLFDKLSASFLPGTVPGSRNKMESELGHHSCLPATYSLSREVINQIDLTDVRV